MVHLPLSLPYGASPFLNCLAVKEQTARSARQGGNEIGALPRKPHDLIFDQLNVDNPSNNTENLEFAYNPDDSKARTSS
ncbi:MAG: hypothetical protein M3Q39_04105 [Actinomycetota bacterium]|nr:hypothetical protein [Actinomycetota bacterium]